MKNIKVKNLVLLVLLGLMCGSALSFAQRKGRLTHKTKAQKEQMLDSTIVRKGIIDLQTIDMNKDGKVFQDQMDWNVISDKPGKCPLCKMTLQEVTLEVAKKNLLANGFKLKK
ncbi:MAG: hypothetical protein HYZ10_11755 [Ignavibacteriales bacterium]|nr:hypothetical protein [Ignavibacteriales bacterium]